MNGETGKEPALSQSNASPSSLFYLTPIVAIAIGVVVFGFFLYKSLSDLSASLTQTLMPGTTEVSLAKPGNYTVFHEYKSVFDGTHYSSSMDLSGLQCSLVSVSTGKTVKLNEPSGSAKYTLADRSGISVFAFIINQPGLYEFTCGYAEGREGPETVLAIGIAFFGDLINMIFVGFLILGASALTAVAAFIVVYQKRKESLKRGAPGAVPGRSLDRPRPTRPE